jgi:hypothetical protein
MVFRSLLLTAKSNILQRLANAFGEEMRNALEAGKAKPANPNF